MEDCSCGQSARAFSQFRMHTDTTRKGVPKEFAGAEQAQAQRAVSSTF